MRDLYFLFDDLIFSFNCVRDAFAWRESLTNSKKTRSDYEVVFDNQGNAAGKDKDMSIEINEDGVIEDCRKDKDTSIGINEEE